MSKHLKIPIHENDHQINSLRAPISIVEYGDFECPYSASAASIINRLMDEYPNEICFIYRHYPLSGIHSFAELAAASSEAAAKQNKFWEMYDQLFTHSEQLSERKIDFLAKAIGLNMVQFHHDQRSYHVLDKVRHNLQNGKLSGVQSTPTLFINGTQYEGATSYVPLKEAIEKELNNSDTAFLY